MLTLRSYARFTQKLASVSALAILPTLCPSLTYAQGLTEGLSIRGAVPVGSALAAAHALIQNYGRRSRSAQNLSDQEVVRLQNTCKRLYQAAKSKEKSGSLLESLKLYDSYVRIRLDSGISGPNDKDIEEILCDLSSLYRKVGKKQYNQYADDLLRVGLALNAHKHGPGDSTSVPILSKLSESYLKQNKFDEAASFYERAVKILGRSHSSNNSPLLQARKNLAQAYIGAGSYKKAENQLKETLSIVEHSSGMNSQELLPILDNYSSVLKSLHREPEALEIQHKAHHIRTLSERADQK